MLTTKICGITLKNPTILASGILGTSAASLIRVSKSGAGAVTTKSISLKKREGHNSPTVVETKGGMLNAIGLSSPKAEEAIEELKEAIKKAKTPVIASFFAKTPQEFSLLAEKISLVKPAFLEANISCPNLKGKIIATDKKLSGKVVEKIKEVTKIPLIVKLTPNVSNIVEIAQAVEEAGADVISAVNTLGPGMVIDIKTASPILGNKFGGLSGPCIKPIAIRCIYEIYEKVNLPLIGIGGITSGEDALEMMMAGATAVGIGTGVLYHNLEIFQNITQEIINFMKEENYSQIKEIIGKAHKD